jgi:regulator of sigma E protease
MSLLFTIIIFIIILAVLILVHELGHFIAAKLSKIRVDEFALGFPPKIISFTKGETRYALNLIPFGGYVKIFGENPDDESISGPDSSRSFVHKPKYVQVIVLIAGITMNVLFAWALFTGSLIAGLPAPADSYNDNEIKDIHLAVTSVSPDSPAAKAGIKGGVTLTAVEYKENHLEGQDLTPENVQNLITESKGEPIHVHFQDGKALKEVDVQAAPGIVEDKLAIGISMHLLGEQHIPFFKAIGQGLKLTVLSTKEVAIGLTNFFGQAFVGKADFNQVSGPVGIVGLVGDAARFGFSYLLSFTALISLNLAVINILPFPALDGGRILFVLIEAIIRRPIKPTIANAVNGIGFMLLILLMLVITYKDIVKLF